nr:ThiF family adenylyltransferase [Streptococcus sp. NLN64]
MLSFFIEQKIVRVLEKDAIQKKINILVVGVGTTGGFTVEALCRNDIFKNLILVDPDIVEISNLYRQVYLEHEIGEYKAQALKNRFPQKNIKCYKQFVSNLDELLAICLEEDIDLIVQCADKPSSKELCRIVTSVCNILEKPCILNYGYLSNVIALPEFYYPNNTYNMDYRHDILDEELILSQILEKSDYTVSIQASFVIAEQIKNYIENKKPIYYQYRGYFSIEKLKWEVEKIE